jgi:DNA-binding MarR family transcriptional regulator
MKRSPIRATQEPANGSTTLEARVFVLLLSVADALTLQAEQLVSTRMLTAAQYNVLRILRGAGPQGASCREIGERMISHDPDITRLLDRMEKHRLIERQRQTDDRRVVKTRITAQGLAALSHLDEPILKLHQKQFQRLSPAKLNMLASLLEKVQQSLKTENPTKSEGER